MSGRELQRKYNVGYVTVNAALTSAFPEKRKDYPERASKLDPFKPVIDEMLRADLDAPRKQRHTIKRIYARLIDEHGMEDVSYQRVRDYVSTRKPQIRIAAGREPPQVFIPQSHHPGEEAEVDFGEVTVLLRGEQVVLYLFSLRMSFSGRSVQRVFASGGQEAFLEGHVHAFTALGGVPHGKIRDDNLKAAVAKVLGLSRARTESERWTVFRSHYGIDDPFYCIPGVEGAHEKGGVEGQIGFYRRNHFVPVPQVQSLEELNARVDQWDSQDLGRRIGARARTIGEHFDLEAPTLKRLPDEEFETGSWLVTRVDRYSMVAARTNKYSVPIRFIGRPVRILLHASWLVVYDGRTEIARHERLIGKALTRVELDHYLEALVRKPGAMAGATALEQARQSGKFTKSHDAWWAAVRKAHGERNGTRAMIEVLLLHRNMPRDQVVAGLDAALRAGALTADAVALEARKAAEAAPRLLDVVDLDQIDPEPDAVASLTVRRLAQLPPDTRPLPSVAIYDQLLRITKPRTAEGNS
ncbi:IS21 family transposase [Nocardia sp. NPDC058666]|uniref:IS21 family transposase n=1 Tax=unclassified Nocardia TaxID=2637762 RepID=UPI00365EBBB0